jgi:hypothetical protein
MCGAWPLGIAGLASCGMGALSGRACWASGMG